MDPWNLTEVSRKVFLEKMDYALLVNGQLRVKESGREGSGSISGRGISLVGAVCAPQTGERSQTVVFGN